MQQPLYQRRIGLPPWAAVEAGLRRLRWHGEQHAEALQGEIGRFLPVQAAPGRKAVRVNVGKHHDHARQGLQPRRC